MNITTQKVDELNAVLTMKIEQADYEAKLNETLKGYRKQAEIKGFRKGMVPMGVVKKLYGKAALAEEVNKVVSENLYKYLVDEKLNILGDPMPSDKQAAIDWDTDLEFEFTFDLGMAPEFDLEISDNDVVPYYTIKVDDDMLNKRIESLTANGGEFKVSDVAEEDCMLKVDFNQVDEDGNLLPEGVSAIDATFLTKTIKDEEVSKAILGKKKDDKVIVEISKAFPNAADLASMLKIEKEVAEKVEGKCELTITEVSKFHNAELNQEFYDKNYGAGVIKTEEEFKAKLTEEIAADLVYESDYKFGIDLKEALAAKYKLQLPTEFLKRWLDATNKELTAEQIEKEWPMFEKDLEWQLIKDKVIREKEIKVEHEDMLDMAKQVTLGQFRQYGIAHLPEEELNKFANQLLENEEQRNKIAENKKDEKVQKALKEMVKLEAKEVSAEEFTKLVQPEAAIPTEQLNVEEPVKDEAKTEE